MSNSCQKGLELEKKISLIFHNVGVPLLVSPKLLRSRGCGQLDLVRFRELSGELKIEILEIKSRNNLSAHQLQRLQNSAALLSQLFDLPVSLKFTLSCAFC